MRIVLSPQYRGGEQPPAMSVAGATFTIGGDAFDFSELDVPGDALPGEAIDHDLILGARNDAGTIEVEVILPIGAEPTQAQAFPEPVTVADGEVSLP